MKNIIKNNYIALSGKKVLISAIAAAITTIMATGITQASDIDLYQSAKSGDTTLMFMLDISASMTNRDGGTTTRMQRVKSAMLDLLQGNAANGVAQLTDDKIIGLSTLGVYSGSLAYNQGAVLVPARALKATITEGGKIITQRQKLINVINNLSAQTNTPTAKSYAETAAYLFGTTTLRNSPRYETYFTLRSGGSDYYAICKAANSSGQCTSWYGFYGGSPNSNWISDMTRNSCTVTVGTSRYTGNCYTTSASSDHYYSGFNYSDSSTKETVAGVTKYKQPDSLKQTEEAKKCSGQGIYVLTDGVPNFSALTEVPMKLSLGTGGNDFSCTDDGGAGWDCVHKYSQRLLKSDQNPSKLVIKTAVVGFGNDFNGVASYNKSLSQAENIRALGVLNTDEKNAAYWGIIGEGGWYSGSSSKDVVDSVNAFINSLGTEIPPISTGSPTIPNDALYPAQLQNFAYYPQFDPTPDKKFQLWAGNLKKYQVSSSGKLVDKFSSPIVESSGKIIDNYDLWSPAVDTSLPVNADINTVGSNNRALMGGAKSQLLLKFAQSTTTENRKLLTNRVGKSGSSVFAGGTTLRQVKASDISDSIYKNDPNRGYLLSLLGFKGLDVANPSSITSAVLSNAVELRQVGAVMHSSPLLLTNEGKITAQNNVLTTTDRKDFVLFGTTQGLVHVVDAVTGKEKFAFVPNEMVENQKEAFLNYDTTSGGINNMFYGVDAPWTSYTEYVVGNNKLLTVGSKTATSPTGVQMVYGGLRMGGSSYYALDLQNIEDPKLQFHIDPVNQKVHFNNSSKSFPQLSSMGQSWSKPQIAWVRWNGQRKRVMLVGGGYDAGYESDEYNQTNAKGAGIYMFDAENGDLLWWSSKNASNTSLGVIGVNNNDLKYSVVSEIRTVDSDEDGLADNLYFGDLGGQLWRVDLDNKATSIANFAKKPVRLLNLNSGATSPRFYDMPAFSVYSHNGSKFAVISVGSGNRSKPLAEYTATQTTYNHDAVYNVYDKDVARSDLLTTNTYKTKDITLTGVGALKEIDNTNRVIQTSSVAPYETSGWFYQFKSNKIQSAKVVGTPSVMNYRMYVSYFDASKPGLSGDCGAGVKGESFLSTFCMPFGQCDKSTSLDDLIRDVPLGAGLQTTTTGNDCEEGQDCSTSTPIPEPVKCVGDKCSSHTNQYCISTGGRVILTPQGGTGGAKTMVCLTPIKWYEKLR